MTQPLARTRHGGRLCVVLLLVAGLGVYANVLRAPFVFDDLFSIVEDGSLRSFATALDVRPGSNADGRPLVGLSLALNYALGGLDAFGYRLFNALVHAVTGVALFLLLRETLRSQGTALACALLWTLHPLNTDALNMVVTRNEALCSLFYLLTLWTAARGFRAERKSPWFAASVLCAFLAAASKETAISLPIAVLLYDRAFGSGTLRASLRRHVPLYVGLALAATFVLVLARGADRGANVGFHMQVPWLHYAGAQIEIAAHYLRLALWPEVLVVDYGDWSVWKGVHAPWLAGLLLLSLVVSSLIGFRKRNGADLLGWTFFATLAPTSLIPMTNEVAAEHRMYLPLAAVVIAVVLLARRALRAAPQAVPISALVVACVALGARTVARNADYNDPVKLWGAALEAYPSNTRAAVFLGDELVKANLLEPAYRVYEQGLLIAPQHNMLLARAAQVLRALGRDGEAQALDERASRGGSGPRYEALAGAQATLKSGETESAIAQLREVIERWPDFQRARVRLATLLATTPEPELRKPQEALRLAQQLCDEMAPPNPAYLDLLGTAYASNGQFNEALDATQKARDLALSFGLSDMAQTIEAKLKRYRAER